MRQTQSYRVSLRLFVFVAVCVNFEVHAAAHHFFQSNASVLVFQRVDIDARARASLKLLASLGGQNDQSILRVNLRRLRLFCYFFNSSLAAIIAPAPSDSTYK